MIPRVQSIVKNRSGEPAAIKVVDASFLSGKKSLTEVVLPPERVYTFGQITDLDSALLGQFGSVICAKVKPSLRIEEGCFSEVVFKTTKRDGKKKSDGRQATYEAYVALQAAIWRPRGVIAPVWLYLDETSVHMGTVRMNVFSSKPLPDVRRWMKTFLQDLLSGLSWLHQNGVVHWDVRLCNLLWIFLTSTQIKCQLTDLGNVRPKTSPPLRLPEGSTFPDFWDADTSSTPERACAHDVAQLGLCAIAQALESQVTILEPVKNDKLAAERLLRTFRRTAAAQRVKAKVGPVGDLLLDMICLDPAARVTIPRALEQLGEKDIETLPSMFAPLESIEPQMLDHLVRAMPAAPRPEELVDFELETRTRYMNQELEAKREAQKEVTASAVAVNDSRPLGKPRYDMAKAFLRSIITTKSRHRKDGQRFYDAKSSKTRYLHGIYVEKVSFRKVSFRPMKIVRRCWRGVRMTVATMDDVGRQWGYSSLTKISSEDEINRTRRRISWRQDREIRRKLQDASHLVIATDGSAKAGEGTRGGCGGATWWASELHCEHEINEDFADWYPVEPICTSTAVVESPIKDAQVDSFDAETFALVSQIKKTEAHLKEHKIQHLIKKVSFYLDPNSVLEGLANMHEKSNIMFFHIINALEGLRDTCMKSHCKFGHSDESLPAIAPESEIEFEFIWNAGHSGLFFNDLVDSLANEAEDRHERAIEAGIHSQVYRKEITASILRRILTNRIRYWLGITELEPTSAPQLVERAREFGAFRPKAGTFPTRYLELLYFYLFSGVVPSGILGAGEARHEDHEENPEVKNYFQVCQLCEEETEGHATHLVMECQCPAAVAARHEVYGCGELPLDIKSQKEVFNGPQKVFKFLHETNKRKKFLKNFACEQIEKNLNFIRPRMTADTKTKTKVDNTYEKLGWKYNSISREMLSSVQTSTTNPVADEIRDRYNKNLEAVAAAVAERKK
ncbi:unnamed protein product [Amoebophrya sp. A120]|nr:unnamed protein product [Amoebophrya sp. A120]|eukprot:GSA120T00023553001.1